ncbi:MAG: thermonuclease family protein [Anaerolineae bacterium]|nr:thermonuclease family protein [Anaerolineae bacterium]
MSFVMIRPRAYFWFCLLFLLPLACGEISDSGRATVPPGDTAQVTSVIDGDTIEVRLGGAAAYRVRYIGVDTPERGDFYYQEAKTANENLVLNQEVILVKDVSETDRFGRLLRYVYLPDGTFVNAELVSQGYARQATFPPDVAQADYFGQLERTARETGQGLWGDVAPCTCSKNSYDCRDFTTQAAAQACYDHCMVEVGRDIHRLDGSGNGVACKSLP